MWRRALGRKGRVKPAVNVSSRIYTNLCHFSVCLVCTYAHSLAVFRTGGGGRGDSPLA